MNVNFPKTDNIKGIKICRQGKGRWIEEFQEGANPRGEKYYWLTGKFINDDKREDADINALAENYVSIVPTYHDLTHNETLDNNILNELMHK